MTPAIALRMIAGLALALCLSMATLSVQQMKEKKSSREFDRMKGLIGTWKDIDSEGKPLNVSYKLVSEGTALMEALGPQDHAESMVTPRGFKAWLWPCSCLALAWLQPGNSLAIAWQ